MLPKTIFISAIDTDSGKTIITGHLAKYLKGKGYKVITQKFAQTGCVGISIDILKHREIMCESLNPFDLSGTTCPYVFEFPASPHLSAKLENTRIDTEKIYAATIELEKEYDIVLLEGVGGLHVPINDHINLIDYIAQKRYPVLLVTSSKLGSINHTLMSLELLKNRGIELHSLIYNQFSADNALILEDSSKVFKLFLKQFFPKALFIEIPFLNNNSDADFNVG